MSSYPLSHAKWKGVIWYLSASSNCGQSPFVSRRTVGRLPDAVARWSADWPSASTAPGSAPFASSNATHAVCPGSVPSEARCSSVYVSCGMVKGERVARGT